MKIQAGDFEKLDANPGSRVCFESHFLGGFQHQLEARIVIVGVKMRMIIMAIHRFS